MPRETGSQNTDATVFLACAIPHLIDIVSKGREMFNNGNLQLVGGAPRREVLRGVWDALDSEDVQAENTQANRQSFLLSKVGSTPLLPEDASSEQRSLLNCILNLSKLLAENAGNKLSPKQIDYAQTIYAAGTQLLSYVDRQALDELTGGSQLAFTQVTPTYHGPRSRRSDDGRVPNAESSTFASSGGRRSVPELAGKKVLIVDDDILNVYAITRVLEQQGMIVMHADNGLAALEMLRAQIDTDAVIMNSGMQALGNHELIGAIRGIPSFTLIPIIAVTADNAQGDREKCVEIGASDFIGKPINMEQLLSLMRAWLTRA